MKNSLLLISPTLDLLYFSIKNNVRAEITEFKTIFCEKYKKPKKPAIAPLYHKKGSNGGTTQTTYLILY